MLFAKSIETPDDATVLVGHDYVLGDTLDAIAQGLANRGIEVVRLPKATLPDHCQVPPQGMEAELARALVIVVSSRTRLDEAVFDRMPLLRGAVFPTIGYNSCDLDAASKREIWVANGVTAENYESMAEATVMLFSALMLELYRKQLGQPGQGAGGRYSPNLRGRMLKGKTIGLIGFGNIAVETVKRLQGWGIREFVVHTRTPQANGDPRVRFCDLPELLRSADIVSIHCPLGPATRNLIGATELAMMKPDAVIVNTARGGILDEDALYRALLEGRIAAAAIDTVAAEPISPDHPLRLLPNVILTQHNIGHTGELFASLIPMGISNVMSLLSGRPSFNTVNRVKLTRLSPWGSAT